MQIRHDTGRVREIRRQIKTIRNNTLREVTREIQRRKAAGERGRSLLPIRREAQRLRGQIRGLVVEKRQFFRVIMEHRDEIKGLQAQINQALNQR